MNNELDKYISNIDNDNTILPTSIEINIDDKLEYNNQKRNNYNIDSGGFETENRIIQKPINYYESIITENEDKSSDDVTIDKNNIMELPFKEIINNTLNVATNFSEEFKRSIAKTELELYGTNNKEYKLLDIIKIHCIALFSYLKNNDTCIYIGIIMVFLSLLIYMFNIIRE